MDEEYIRDEQEQERRRLIRMELKRKQARQQKIMLITLGIVLLLITTLLIKGCVDKHAAKQLEKDKNSVNDHLNEEVQDVIVTLAAVGDIMCYEDQMEDAKLSDGKYDFSPSFVAIKPYLEAANLTVGNLELTFCGSAEGYGGYPNFNAPESLAKDLHSVGFDILQTANTYSIQGGINGLQSTIRYLTLNDIEHLGTYASQAEKATNEGVTLKNINGIKFAFIGYTKGLNNLSLPTGSEYAVDVLFEDYSTNYSKINEKALIKSVQAAKDMDADVIIAMLHWGNENKIEPFSTQKEIADLLFKNGVDVILGSHSHEVGPMEMRKVTVDGKEKEVFLAYSLGNFFSSMDRGTSRIGVVLNLEFTMDAETGAVKMSKADYLPIQTVDKGENATTRFEVLPIRTAMSSSTFSYMKADFEKSLATLEKNAGANFDSGK